MDAAQMKKLVGYQAADTLVRSGMKIGMGTGSTAVWAIRRIGDLQKEGKLEGILGVPTSFQSRMECELQNIPIHSLNDPDIGGCLDLVIDGADEVDPEGSLIKGGGGALLIEKIVAYNSKTVAIVVDESKIVENLGLVFPVPIEVVPEARTTVTRALKKYGAEILVRMAVKKMGPVITDNGNIILDIRFKDPVDPAKLETEFNMIPGVMENGFFSRCSPQVFIGHSDGRIDVREN
jgi:ribose 5-phosphate isomerase A